MSGVTSLVAAMLSSALVRSVLDSAPDAMIIIDSSGGIVFANQQVTKLFGYASADLVGQPVETLLPERFRHRHVAHRHGYVENVRVRPMGIGLDLFARRQDGSEFPVEISLSPIWQEGEVLSAAAIRDVTQRKRVEQELKNTRAEADRANIAKSRFLATASHDLRQPLQSLALLNGTLKRLVGDADALDALDQQDQAISAMSRLLNALLDISKLESGAIKPEITDFAVASLFEELRAEFAGLAANKGLGFKVDVATEHARTDPSLLGQVLRNLIANAIKYTRQGWVHLRCLPRAGSVYIEVLDTGIGIPKDQLAYIYDEFYQVGVATNSSRDGYGLGLSIVQRLVRLLNLNMDVQSEIGKGSAFSIELPIADASYKETKAAAAPRRMAVDEKIASKHLLLVEDDAAVRKATRMLLKVEGYRVTAVATLGEATQAALENPDIEAIVTDYHLSRGETGIEVIAAAREHLGASCKAVLVTGDTSSAVQALSCDAHLRIASKPVNADQLLSLLKSLLVA